MERFGQYILLEKVGSGGMAELFKAKKIGIEGFERVLAIKRILPHLSSDEEFIEMFIAEAKLAARLSHKNIAQVYDFGKMGQNYFIAMEYVRGKDLKSIFKKCKEGGIKLPAVLAVYIAKEVASALGYAHNQKDTLGKSLNIIHRDVSPQNILISYEGEVKVVDFGIAKAGAHSKTSTGVLKGKLPYMSPEQAWGKPLDHRSDIFSLGIVFYEMLTGERLFKGDSEINTLEKVREAKVEPLPTSIESDLPLGLEAKVLKALAKKITDRYQDSSVMEADLGDTLLKLSSANPALALKQFMRDLFKAEIEAEHKSEIREETVSIQFEHEQKPVLKPKEKEEKKPLPPPPPKRKIYPYVISASFVLGLVIAVFIFLSHKAEKAMSPVPEQSVNSIEKQKSNLQSDKQQNTVQKSVIEKGGGRLTINAVPWANVTINGETYGTTPITVEEMKGGIYKVKLENPNFPAWETKVKVLKGATAKVSYKFGGFGKIIINASPWGNVYLDGVLKGQTPLTLERVPAAKHQIRVVREGFAEFNKTFNINEGATERLSVILKKDVES